ncbi:MAG: hypothetical protein E7Z73_07045 [Methanobrevibacter millerae]|uniref:Uncharacterized protein n=1 Tax=Methanobrevibacter millerae TaxID=230361 RepID=A0A8T3VH43_9EURY|nr:hypothetical protein [Methanobrevibacter millerae]MBE6505476.1 hypothetical protein [Methanobrevibacter millerae]
MILHVLGLGSFVCEINDYLFYLIGFLNDLICVIYDVLILIEVFWDTFLVIGQYSFFLVLHKKINLYGSFDFSGGSASGRGINNGFKINQIP